MRIIDAHVHVQPWSMVRPEALELMTRGRDAETTRAMMDDPAKFVAYLDREGVEWAVNINYTSPQVIGFTDDVNEWALEYAAKAAGRVVPIGSVHPRLTEDVDRRLDELVKLGLRGLKVHPAHQELYPNEYRQGLAKLGRIYRRAEKEGLILYVHTGTSVFPGARNVYTDPIHVDDVAVDFPKLRIVLAHGGRPLWMETAFFLLRRHPNMWLDLSSIPPRRILEYFPRLAEVAERVVFGSDWPGPSVSGIRANAEAVAALPLPEKTLAGILAGNVERLFAR